MKKGFLLQLYGSDNKWKVLKDSNFVTLEKTCSDSKCR